MRPEGLVVDPLSGRKVVFAPGRGRRSGAYEPLREPGDPGEHETCPFCEGREHETPPELFVLGAEDGRQPDTPGWKVRVVSNLYPAFERQQVVIHSPEHIRSIADLPDGQLALVSQAWAEVAERAWRDEFDHLFVFVNEGSAAGASRAHSHSQLVWLKEAPPEILAEDPRLSRHSCALCKLLSTLEPSLRLAERRLGAGAVSLSVAPAGRSPYELLIAPEEHLPDAFGEVELLAAALSLAAEGVRRLTAVEGPSPVNLWLHNFQSDGHWHFELVPRLSIFAGVELGAGIFVNTLEPGEAASRLREGV
jgi:UDPglucose--hexose-1-phosphate uridylyltransferase